VIADKFGVRLKGDTVSKIFTRGGAVGGLAAAMVVVAALPAVAAPNPRPEAPAGVGAKLDTLLGYGMYFVIVACVAGVLICAAKLALAIRHGEGAEAAGRLGAVGFACVLIGSAAGIVNGLV
jgi:hypothetical protein